MRSSSYYSSIPAQLFVLSGIFVLVLSITVAQNIVETSPPGFLGVLREGVVIFGWVSVWKPIELLLFDWYPLFDKFCLYRKLSDAVVETVGASRDDV